MFAWVKKLLGGRPPQNRGQQHYAVAEGSELERCAIAGLMLAIEADEVAAERRPLTQGNQLLFMMGYECCMMWAIKFGTEKACNPKQTQSLVLAMTRHLAKHGWYQSGAFEKIWTRVEDMMPIAMNMTGGPDAPPPYPVAELQIALDQAGYHLDQTVGMDFKFGMYMFIMMRELTKAAEAAARDIQSA